MATLKDVAKDAGVSIATVSCCLSGSRYVKPETRTKIMDSIEKLKYIPNASARDLRSTSTNRIGVVLTDIDNIYHTEIFKGISASLQRKGYWPRGIPNLTRELSGQHRLEFRSEPFYHPNRRGLSLFPVALQTKD